MVRALAYLAFVALLGSGLAWVADHPGAVAVAWGDWRIDTSLAAALAAIVALAVFVTTLVRIWQYVIGLPRRVVRGRRERRRRRGYAALTRGMVAVAAGDATEARRQARRADSLLEEPPLTLLLQAQAAQLNGDEKAAQRFFAAMLERKETRFLGLRGLMSQALKTGDDATALSLAERAHALRPKAAWVQNELFDLRVRAGRWSEAEFVVVETVRTGNLSDRSGRERRARLKLAMSEKAAAAGNAEAALDLARAALRLDPGFVPAAVRIAKLLAADKRKRRAERILEQAWDRAPHRLLAEAYIAIHADEPVLQQVIAFEKFRARHPEHIESHRALGFASLKAGLWGEARTHLSTVAERQPSRDVFRALAELEELAYNDAAAARRWLARAATAPIEDGWTCRRCATEAGEWTAACPHCGAFDGLAWSSRGAAQAPVRAGAALPPTPATAGSGGANPAAG